MTITRPIKVAAIAILVVLLAVVLVVAVSGFGPKGYRRVACASVPVESAQKAGGSGAKPASSPTRYTPPKSATPPSRQNAAAKAPSPQHEVAHKNQAKAPASQNSAKAKVTPPGEKSYTPPPADRRPPAKQYDKAAYEAPERVSRGGSYRSPVTNHTYVYHDPIWYSSPGYRLDLFDPYNPWNYTNPYSPFFGRQFVVVDAC